MAGKKAAERKRAVMTQDEIKSGIKKIDRRIEDLKNFDVGVIRKRFDPVAEALKDKVNGTLQDIFDVDTVEYNEYSVWNLDSLPITMGGGEYSLGAVRAGYQEGIDKTILKLRTLRDLLDERLTDYVERLAVEVDQKTEFGRSRKVFVVHGHDDGLKEMVARYLSKLQFDPIILHEQPSHGRTIIEKFEQYADVDFAVVLFTPDDVGGAAGSVEVQRHRARQNVILELGFFLGKLGRQRVCVLYVEGIEMPSDYSGVLYVPVDKAGHWRLQMAKEIKASGLSVDMNLAI